MNIDTKTKDGDIKSEKVLQNFKLSIRYIRKTQTEETVTPIYYPVLNMVYND